MKQSWSVRDPKTGELVARASGTAKEVKALVRKLATKQGRQLALESGPAHNPGRERAAADPVAARELEMFIENNAGLYRQQYTPIMQNLWRKMVKGTYDHGLAKKLWLYLATAGAKLYAKESGSQAWSEMFTVATREIVASSLADSGREALENREWSDTWQKGEPKKNPRATAGAWQHLDRGSYRLKADNLEADVFKMGGEGWRWNILDTNSGAYVHHGKGLASLKLAQEAAEGYMGLVAAGRRIAFGRKNPRLKAGRNLYPSGLTAAEAKRLHRILWDEGNHHGHGPAGERYRDAARLLAPDRWENTAATAGLADRLRELARGADYGRDAPLYRGRYNPRNKLPFDAWMGAVDMAVQAKAGLSVYDLGDCSFMDWYEHGVTPKSAASRAIRGGMENPIRPPAGRASRVGQRVQLHAATDEWMQGDRYGVIVGYGRARDYRNTYNKEITKVRPIKVKLDKSGRIRRFHPESVFEIEDNPGCRGRIHNPGCPCDPRCVSAVGDVCECRCRGANHKSGQCRLTRNPRTVQGGGAYIFVTMSKREVQAFKARWPASGLPDKAIEFIFDSRNGDLIGYDINLQRAEGSGALVALSQTAWDERRHENPRAPIDWAAKEEQARGMDTPQLQGAMRDISKTLPYADAHDRAEGGGSIGGYYRDESSVYRAELQRRGVIPRSNPGREFDHAAAGLYQLNNGEIVAADPKSERPCPKVFTNRTQAEKWRRKEWCDGDFEVIQPRMGPAFFLRYVGPLINPSWRVSGTLTADQLPEPGAVAEREPAATVAERELEATLAREPMIRAAVEAELAADESAIVAEHEDPADLRAGERVSVPYSGRASYFGRRVQHTREGGIFEGYTANDAGERLAFVRVNRGRGVETHSFPVAQVRRHGKTYSEQAAVRRAGRPAKLAALERKAKGSLPKAQAMLDKATEKHAAAYAVAMALYPQLESEPGRPRGRTQPASRAYLNARAKMRRQAEKVELLTSLVRSLGYGQAGSRGADELPGEFDAWSNPSRSRRARERRQLSRMPTVQPRRLYRAKAAGRWPLAGRLLSDTISRGMAHTAGPAELAYRNPSDKLRPPHPDTRPQIRKLRPRVWSVLVPIGIDVVGNHRFRVVSDHATKPAALRALAVLRYERDARTISNPGRSGERERGDATFEMWHEFPPSKGVKRIKVPYTTWPKHMVKLGEVVRIDYKSNKWVSGKNRTYTHATKHPRPILVTDPDALAVSLIGGAMRATADGLVN